MPYCVFDFETYSEAPISKVGAYEYAAHKSTKILCAAWQILDDNRHPLSPVCVSQTWRGDDLSALAKVLSQPGMIAVAHNLMFELAIAKHCLGWEFILENCEDTAVLASAFGLPRALEKAAEALELKNAKSDTGKRLIAQICQPSKHTPTETDYIELLEYCIQDVKTQVELFQNVPLLAQVDRHFWLTNMRMNLRGFEINRPFAELAVKLLDDSYQKIDRRFHHLTGISSATKTAATLKWLKTKGYAGDSLTKQAIGESVVTDPEVREVLELRALRAKASVKKYPVMLERSAHDGRARDTTIFYGAHTGRDAGVGLQPQNLGKSTVDRWEVDYLIDQIQAGHRITPIIPTLHECIRGAIQAKKGHKLVVADFAGIELRVLFWLARHTKGLDAIRSGKDLYKEMAAIIYNKPVDQVTKAERQLGKQVVLGAGYGIGVNGEKFQAAAKAYGMDVPLDLAQRAIRAYRNHHSPIPALWSELESACVKAVLYPGKAFACGPLSVRCASDLSVLGIDLPAGRTLFYQAPKITSVATPSGGMKYELTFRGVHGPAKKFERRKTWGGTLVENVVQAIARDILYAALVRLEAADVDPVLAVHDEGVFEVLEDFDSDEIQQIMEQVPAWATGLPIDVELWEGKRYGK